MKRSLLLAGLLATSGPLAAQPLPPVATAGSLAAPPVAAPAAPDTVAALHRLFAAKRRRQGYVVSGTAVVAVGTLIGLASNRPAPGPSNPNFAVYAGGGDLGFVVEALLTLPSIAVAAVAFGGWGHRQEQRVVAEWQQQHRLPRWVRRKLRPRHFRAAWPPRQSASAPTATLPDLFAPYFC